MFGTSGIRGPVGETVTADLALAVGRAVATDGADTVVIGRDARDSGRFLADAAAAGCAECGADVIDLGLTATPTLARSIARLDADAGIVVTASHNPPEDNGLKLWTPSGQAFDTARRDRITDIIDREAYDFAPWDASGERTTEGAADAADAAHTTAVVDAIDDEAAAAMAGLEAVVDVGNGVGSVTADALGDLGAAVTTLNAQPDGAFPGRPSEPTAETLTALRAQVGNTNADLGIAHDGDADRMVAVDETGAFVPKDVLLALFARRAVDTAGGGVVAAPVDTSLCVDDAIEPLDGSVNRTKVGDVFVAEAAASDGTVFGGEPSGAWIWPEETLCPDGSLAAAKLTALVATDGSLSEQVASVETYPIQRRSIEVADKAAVMERVADDMLAEYDNVATSDGVRAETDTGWVLVRSSGTQPLIRITAEARSEAAAEDLLAAAVDRVNSVAAQVAV
ncbi:phosphoglucosamine mutase [Halonotius terrestris]|uniref:Phosphoglucosamine mutase n=1 Tax=Halonotius terrestris TaxID=2487750 RepID=A0A8J8TCI7_9EURY|nr:phosphoglucosamine mutase [Halonotius terrestris]TQQ81009.1 phosphoglucosamine mutase [Halonotius terrestris]